MRESVKCLLRMPELLRENNMPIIRKKRRTKEDTSECNCMGMWEEKKVLKSIC